MQVFIDVEWYVLQQVVKGYVNYQWWYEVIDEDVLVLYVVLVGVFDFGMVVKIDWMEEQ